jgi:hypothetical protein
MAPYSLTSDLGALLSIGADDPHAGNVLLRERGERAELLLHFLESFVDDTSHEDADDGEEDHRQQREPRQAEIDAQHEEERERAAGDGVRQVHDRRTHSHAHGRQIVRQSCHEIARAEAAVERRVERLELREQIVAQVVLDPSAHTVQELAHPVAERTANDGDRHHQGRQAPDYMERNSRPNAIQRSPEKPRNHARACSGHNHERHSACNLRAVRVVIREQSAEGSQRRHVACPINSDLGSQNSRRGC